MPFCARPSTRKSVVLLALSSRTICACGEFRRAEPDLARTVVISHSDHQAGRENARQVIVVLRGSVGAPADQVRLSGCWSPLAQRLHSGMVALQ